MSEVLQTGGGTPLNIDAILKMPCIDLTYQDVVDYYKLESDSEEYKNHLLSTVLEQDQLALFHVTLLVGYTRHVEVRANKGLTADNLTPITVERHVLCKGYGELSDIASMLFPRRGYGESDSNVIVNEYIIWMSPAILHAPGNIADTDMNASVEEILGIESGSIDSVTTRISRSVYYWTTQQLEINYENHQVMSTDSTYSSTLLCDRNFPLKCFTDDYYIIMRGHPVPNLQNDYNINIPLSAKLDSELAKYEHPSSVVLNSVLSFTKDEEPTVEGEEDEPAE